MCWFAAQETLLLIITRAAKYFCENVLQKYYIWQFQDIVIL